MQLGVISIILAGLNLMKAKFDGTEKIKLAKNVFEFGVADGYVYFIDGKPDHHSIKSIAIDGSNLKELKNDGIYDQIFVENGWIYYTGRDRFVKEKIPLTRMKIDGTEKNRFSMIMFRKLILLMIGCIYLP